MEKIFSFRKITLEDWEILLDWRNDINTRKNSVNEGIISKDEHINYLKTILSDNKRQQYLFLYNKIPVGTIKQNFIQNDTYKLSYTINPTFQGKKLGQSMINLFLFENKGKFICEVKQSNIPSIKIIEKIGFKKFNQVGKTLFFEINIDKD